MASNNIVIRGTTYPSVPTISVPSAEDESTEIVYRDTSDATLTSGSQMLSGVGGYGPDGWVDGSIATKTASNLTASGATVTAPAGYYETSASKTVASGSAKTPTTTITATPTITVSSAGLITASVSASQSVTPTVSAGWVSAGTAGTVTASGSATEQLTAQAAQTILPSTSSQTIESGTYLTGTQTIAPVTVTNLSSSVIASGTTVKVGTTSDDDCIVSVAGSLVLPVITQDSDGALHIS